MLKGFAPECAWVTYGGNEKLEERLCVRPTSETLFCEHFKNIVHSHRDLPKLYNQWVSVVRWEKTTRPFLRSREFLWQEGFTHSTQHLRRQSKKQKKCLASTPSSAKRIWLCLLSKVKRQRAINLPVRKEHTALKHLCTTARHFKQAQANYFGDGFAKAFDIQFADKNNQLQYPHQTSWGVTTRLIGAIIMTHGDDNGLVLPPAVAPIQAIVIPVAQHKDGVLDAANELCDRLNKVCRAKIDDSNNTPGWKFAEYEMKGVPVRIELGPRDIEAGQCVVVTRHNREKTIVPLDKIEEVILEKLEEVRKGIYEKALENRERRTYIAHNMDEIIADLEKNGDGFVKAMWCGDEACEDKVKEVTGVGSRCIPLEQEHIDDKCVCCGKPAKCMVYWGKAY